MSALARRPQQAAPETSAPAADVAAATPMAASAAAASGLAAPEESETPVLDAAGPEEGGGIAGDPTAPAAPDEPPAAPPSAADEERTEAPTESEAEEEEKPEEVVNPDVSRNAEDPAPSGWAAEEVATVPASKVDPDDAGHVYHLLEDGSVVVTSVPFTVTGPVADAVRADAANRVGKTEARTNNVAVDTNAHALEQAVTFETNLGLAAASDGKGASQAVMDKVMAYLYQYARVLTATREDLDAMNEEVKAKVKSVLPKLGTNDASVAGAVGTEIEPLVEVLVGGNLREQMTILFNFMRFFSESMLKMTEAQRTTVIAEARLGADALKKRMDEISAEAKSIDPTAPADASGQTGAQQLAAPTGLVRNATTGEFAVGGTARMPSLADVDNKLISGQDRARIDGGNKPSSRTIGSLEGTGAELSDREKAIQGAGRSVPEGQELEDQNLQWAEGADKWMADQTSQFVQMLEATQVPFGAGPSGTTARLMSTAQELGYGDANGMRLACIGYLLPIRAHSLVEIMVSAAAYGCPAPLPGLMMYTQIAPYDDTKLKGFSGGKFPHEWAAEAADDAPATTT